MGEGQFGGDGSVNWFVTTERPFGAPASSPHVGELTTPTPAPSVRATPAPEKPGKGNGDKGNGDKGKGNGKGNGG